MPSRVVVVDDDPTITDVVSRYLTRAGHEVLVAADGATALHLARTEAPDLVVLDLMLPGIGGLEVCRRLRATSTVPVIMVTARADEADRITGLELGADDYVAKPFSPRELVLRVEAVLRRSGALLRGAGAGAVSDGDLVVDLAAHEARLGDDLLALTAREFDLLAFLLAHPRTALTRRRLLDEVWDWEFGDESTVTVHVRRLREKIEPDATSPRRIVTVWGVGYRFDPLYTGDRA
ncbi:response regulator transcription factor [Cellulomonas cellasea]|uniref:DNA-binding response OmpR family regulator n=1 Tax=Cellulomonas cellasea TaxID=43670 RepID=A0A7W4UDG7_9CELL|nr:response regulator transcription factor [Cellulomonas cellasea]MBB2922200.1 DNA-binding response OmpR family regulator [Cellulomonas cellasea]